MKNNTLLLLASLAAAIYYFTQSKPNPATSTSAKAGSKLGTGTTGGPSKGGTLGNTNTDKALKGTADTISTATDAYTSIAKSVGSIFGGWSKSTGSSNRPTTTGSGAGVPSNRVATDTVYDNRDVIPQNVDTSSDYFGSEYDQYSGGISGTNGTFDDQSIGYGEEGVTVGG